MRLLDPLALTWLTAAVIPLLLYIVRPRARRRRVSTLLFFKSLAREHQESAWLRRLKRLLSLLLSLLVVIGAVLALGRLVAAPPAGSVRSVVIVIDRSASMAASVGGPTRLDEARHIARAKLAGLSEGVAVSVVAYDHRPEVLLPRSLDRRAVERALASMAVRPMQGDAAAALHLAEQVAAIQTPAAIWHVTDELPEDAAVAADASEASDRPVALEHLCVALPSPTNVGVTAFEIRRSPMQRDQLEAFVQFAAVGPAAVDAKLDVRRGENLIAVRRVAIEPGQPQQLVMPIDARGDGVLSLHVGAKGDALRVDDQLLARVPPAEPIDVLWISAKPDAVTQFALQSLGQDTQVRVFAGGPEAWPGDGPVDVVVFESWLPEAWPRDVPVIVIDPPRSLGPVRAAAVAGGGLPVTSPRVTHAEHAVLYGVAASRVALLQKSVLDADPARSGLEPLWVGPAGPLLAVGEVDGQRLVIMPFSAVESENLWRLPSYPLLIGNAIYWATQPTATRLAGNNRRCGDLLVTAGTSITWSSPDVGLSPAGTTPIAGRWAELDHVGLWGTDAGESGSAALLSPEETRLPSRDGPVQQLATPAGSGWLAGHLATPLLWIILATLLLESVLFHLYSVY